MTNDAKAFQSNSEGTYILAPPPEVNNYRYWIQANGDNAIFNVDRKWKVGKAQDLGRRDCNIPNSCSLISTEKSLWPHDVTNWQYRSGDHWTDSNDIDDIVVQGKLGIGFISYYRLQFIIYRL